MLLEAGGVPAYWPWVQAIRSYIRDKAPDDLRSLLGPGASDVAQMLPDPGNGVGEGHPLATVISELVREPSTARITLHGFDERGVTRLIEVAANHSRSGSLVAAIYRETEGNPLFVSEIVRLLAAEGRLDRASATATWRLGVPEGIRAVILRRLGHLSFDCTRILSLASIVGQEFSIELLERLAGLAREELVDVVAEAMSSGVVTEVALGRMRFGHALFRETLYGEMPLAERSRLHRTVAEALEAQWVLR